MVAEAACGDTGALSAAEGAGDSELRHNQCAGAAAVELRAVAFVTPAAFGAHGARSRQSVRAGVRRGLCAHARTNSCASIRGVLSACS